MTPRFLSPAPSSDPLDDFWTTRRTSKFPSKELVAAFVVILASMVAGVVFFTCLRRQCSRKRRRPQGVNLKKLNLRRFRFDELERATMSFSKECLVGSGAFGNVYRGVFGDEQILAIKRSHADSYQSTQEFRNEVELLSRVKHDNLVGLVGYCEEQNHKILIYEYVPHGSLLEYIVGRKRESLTWRQRVNIAIGAAKGIAHLHAGVKPSIIHRDIKPSNILIGNDFEAKVSDFGLVKSGPVGDESHVSSQIKGTPGYLDPSYCASYHLTPFSDVYSFGIILLQLVTARPAVASAKSHSQYHIVDWAKASLERGNVEEIIDSNLLTEPCNMEMMLKMGQLGLKCIVKIPKNRPTMNQVVQELEEALPAALQAEFKQPSRVSIEPKAPLRSDYKQVSRDSDELKTSPMQSQYKKAPKVSHELNDPFHSECKETAIASLEPVDREEEEEEEEEEGSFSIDAIGLQKFVLVNDSIDINTATMQYFNIGSTVIKGNELESCSTEAYGR